MEWLCPWATIYVNGMVGDAPVEVLAVEGVYPVKAVYQQQTQEESVKVVAGKRKLHVFKFTEPSHAQDEVRVVHLPRRSQSPVSVPLDRWTRLVRVMEGLVPSSLGKPLVFNVPARVLAATKYALLIVGERKVQAHRPREVAGRGEKWVSPIFAYRKGCAEFAREGRASEVLRLGTALQLDLGTLTGRYGRVARKQAERFLGDGLYALAATDLHAPEVAREWIGEALAALEKRAGASGLRRLCEENPRRALAGEELG